MPHELTDERIILDITPARFTPAQLGLFKAARRIVITLLHLLDELIASNE